MLAEKIHRTHLEKMIEKTKGQFFTVVFIKTDGSERVMNCRTGVHNELVGGTCRAVRPDTPYKTVWSVHDKAYRLVNLHTISEIRWNHVVYEVWPYITD